jgi:hypothetical protein
LLVLVNDAIDLLVRGAAIVPGGAAGQQQGAGQNRENPPGPDGSALLFRSSVLSSNH